MSILTVKELREMIAGLADETVMLRLSMLREAWWRAVEWLEDAMFPPPAGLRPRRSRGWPR